MRALASYFRQHPVRLLYAALLLAALGWLLRSGFLLAYQAEIFAKLVHDPDHRMHREDSHFSGLNSDNLRSAHEAADIRDEDFNIVFLGDSFIYGFLLNREQAPPAQLEQILRERFQRDDINVINAGWTSSSPFLSWRLLQEIHTRYKPDLVLLSVDMSDYRDEWFYKSVIERRGFYQTVVQYPRASFWLKHLLEFLEPAVDWHTPLFGYSGVPGYFVARQPLEKSRNLFDDIFDTLLQMNTYCRDVLHAPFVVFMPPRHWQYTDREAPDTWEKGGFDTLGPYALENYHYFASRQGEITFPFYTLLDEFRATDRYPLNFRVDSHWNKHGARFFAEQVADKITPMMDSRLRGNP